MDKLDGPLPEDIIDNDDTVVLTLNINHFYNDERTNCFGDIKSETMEILHVLLGFVKHVQKFTKSNEPNDRVYFQYWRDVSKNSQGTVGEAYSIVYHSPTNVSMLDAEFEKYRLERIQGIKFYTLIPVYDRLCKGTLEHSDIDYTVGNDLPYNEEGDEINFTRTFSYGNTKRYLSRNEGNFVPLVAFLLKNNKNFFWEALSRTAFPWSFYSLFERLAKEEMTKIKTNIGEFKFPSLAIDLIAGDNWQDRKDLTSSGNNNNNATDNNATNRPRGRQAKKFSYFDADSKKKRRNERKRNNGNRIFNMNWSNHRTGPYQKNKHPLHLLRTVAEKYPNVDIKFMKEVFNGFWNSTAVYRDLSLGQSGVHQYFFRDRNDPKNKEAKLIYLPEGEKMGLTGLILNNIILAKKTFFGLSSSGTAQALLQMIARESTTCILDPNNFNLCVIGLPGIGKSFVAKTLMDSSIPGTMFENSIKESPKANFCKIIVENFTTTINNDVGSIYSMRIEEVQKRDSVMAEQRSLLGRISDGNRKYKVLVLDKTEELSGFESRKSQRIENEFLGSIIALTNYPLGSEELRSRFCVCNAGDSNAVEKDKRRVTSCSLKAAAEISKQFKVIKATREPFCKLEMGIQGDSAMFDFWCYSFRKFLPGGNGYNLSVALYVMNFISEIAADEIPIWNNSSRKANNALFIAIAFAKYRVRTELCTLPGGKYFGVDKIHDPGEFAEDFSKRMIVGYEEIIPAMFVMLPEYVNNIHLELAMSIKNKILFLNDESVERFKQRHQQRSSGEGSDEYTLDLSIPPPITTTTNPSLEVDPRTKLLTDWFNYTVKSRNSQSSVFRIGIVTVEKSSSQQNRPRPQQRRGGSGDDPCIFTLVTSTQRSGNSRSGNRDGLDFTVAERWIDPNYIKVSTKLKKEHFYQRLSEIFRMKHTPQVIGDAIESLCSQTILVKEMYEKYKLEGDGTISPTRPLKKKKVYPSLYLSRLRKEFDRTTTVTTYIFPTLLFENLDLSPYEVLKKIVVEKLPYAHQGEDIRTVGIKMPPGNMKVEPLLISRRNAERNTFEFTNPKVMDGEEQTFFDHAIRQITGQDGVIDDDRQLGEMIRNERFVFDYSLYDVAYKKHIDSKLCFENDCDDDDIDDERDLKAEAIANVRELRQESKDLFRSFILSNGGEVNNDDDYDYDDDYDDDEEEEGEDGEEEEEGETMTESQNNGITIDFMVDEHNELLTPNILV
jgi:hypothetical protein